MSATGHKRRTLLAAGVGATTTLASCGLLNHAPAPAPASAPADPLRPMLDEALALAAAYERAALAQPGLAARLAPLAADHRAHAAELARTSGIAAPPASGLPPDTSGGRTAPNSGPPPDTSGPASAGTAAPASTLAELRTSEQAAQWNAVAACRRAPAARAALLGSIAACRATHAEALR